MTKNLTWEQNELLLLRDRVRDLEDENSKLRSLLNKNAVFPDAWHLTRVESRLLAALVTASGYRPYRELMRDLYGSQARSAHIGYVLLRRIRMKLRNTPIVIRSRFREGYELNQESRAYIAAEMARSNP